MFRYQKHQIAYYIYNRLNEHNSYSITDFKIILHIIFQEPPTINNQNQLKLYHSARAAKNKYGLIDRDVIRDVIIYTGGENILFIGFEQNAMEEINLDTRHLIDTRHLNLTEIGASVNKIQYLKDKLMDLANTNPENDDNEIDNNENDDNEIDNNEIDDNEIDDNNIDDKITALHELMTQLRGSNISNQIANRGNLERGERFLQTIIGAAIFYCPSSVNHWNGKISYEALKNLARGERITKDHINPRRLSAIEMMQAYNNGQIRTANDLNELYHENYAKYSYLTSQENSSMVNYWLEFENYQEGLENRDIFILPRGERHFDRKIQLNRFINANKADLRNDNIDLEETNNRINEFLRNEEGNN